MRARTMVAIAGTLLALTSRAAVAQEHGQNHGQAKKAERAAQAQHKAESRRQAESQREAAARFRDEDHENARAWYREHDGDKQHGFRDSDRLDSEHEGRLQRGYVFDNDMRRRSYSAPVTLTRVLAPAPRGYRYVVIGNHVVLVDERYRVADVFRLNLN